MQLVGQRGKLNDRRQASEMKQYYNFGPSVKVITWTDGILGGENRADGVSRIKTYAWAIGGRVLPEAYGRVGHVNTFPPFYL